MAIKINTTNVNSIVYKDGSTNNDVKKVILDGNVAWCKPFTYTTGTLPTGVASLTCKRSAKSEPTAATGTVANNGTIYYEDKLYWTATASTGYNNPTVTYGSSSNTLTVDAVNITDVVGSTYVTAGARISGTYSQGTLPTGVASLTCYRKSWNGSSYTVFTSGTIYYGDSFYWTATASAGYNNPTVTYYDNTHTYTWNGTQGGSLVGVTTSGVKAGSRITWTANVTMGTGITKYKYSTDGGTTWSSETTAATVANLDYAKTLTVKGTTASAGYTVNGNTATATYSSKNVTVPAATRIKWSLTVTQANYVASWRYKIDNGSWTTKTATFTISNVDYASKVTVECLSNEGASGYTYGAYQGEGTFGSGAQSTNLSTTLNCSRTRITWALAVTMSNYVTGWRYKIDSGSWVSKTASYTISGVDYASKVTVEGTSKESAAGYTYGDYSGTGTFGSGSQSTGLSTTLSCTRTRITWNASVSLGTGVAKYKYSTDNGTTWSDETTAASITGLDYATVLTVKATTASEGYTVTSTTATASYSNQSVTVPACTRIKWSYTINLGTGQASVKYKIDSGSYTTITASTTVNNIDYGSTLTIVGVSANAGYTPNTSTYTRTYANAGGSITISATRITWSMAVTMSNYVTGWRYKIDSGSWVNKTASYTITGIDYASKITIEGTSKEGTAGYNYGEYQGTGTFGDDSQDTNLSTTLSCTRTRITWSLAVTQSDYIASWTYKIGSQATVSKSASYTINGIDYADKVVITATNQSEVQYNYGVPTGTGTFGSGTQSTNLSTTLASTREVKEYTLTISVTNPSYGTYSVSRTSSPYKGASTGSLTNGATIYYGDVLTGSASGKGISYGSWNITSVTAPTVSSNGDATSGNLTVTNKDSHTATLYYNTSSAVGGTSIGSAAANASITKTGLLFNTQYYVSARVSRSRDKYDDATDGSQYSGTNEVTGNVTASFKFKRTTTTDTGTIDSSVVSAKTASRNTYAVNISATNCKSTYLSETSTATSGSTSGTKFNYGATVYGFATLNDDDAQYTYTAPSGWVQVGGTSSRTYRIGSVVVNTSGNSISGSANRTVKSYNVSITRGTGLSDVYLATTSTATTGVVCDPETGIASASYNYGSTVYAFVTLAEHYDIPSDSNWVLVYGTKDATGSKYRVGSVSVTGTHNFGTFYAVIEKYNLSITKGTGIDKIYYKVNGASSYSNTSSNLSIAVNDLSDYYYYATAATGYTANADCGSSSSPKSGTVNCADISKSVTATIKSYTITWKWLSAYPNTWTTATESYNHGATPSRTLPSSVDNGSGKKLITGWDDLSVVTANRTIIAEYQQQYYLTFSGTRCSCNKITGWYNDSSTAFTATWTASTNCAFNSTGSTTTTTESITPNQAGSYSKSADYIYVTVTNPTYCTVNKSTGWHAYNTQCTWTRNTGYAFDSSGTSTATDNFTNPGGTYNKIPGYGYYTLTLTNCTRTSGHTAGWYTLNTSISTTAKANSGYSFGGSTAQDSKTLPSSGTLNPPCSQTFNPTYWYVTIQATNSSANKSTGWYNASFTCTWTASTNYAFDNAGTTTSTQTISSPGTYSKTAGYGKYTVTTTNSTANVSTGWYAVANSKSTTFTASTGWSFGGSTTGDTTSKSAAVPGSVSASPSYCQITVKGSNCTIKVGDTTRASNWSGIVANGTQIIYTANTSYAFDSNGTATKTVTVNGPNTYNNSPNYGKYTVTATNSTANVSTGWYTVTSSKSTTFTANSGWSFGGTTVQDTTSKSAAVPGSVSASPTYCNITISNTNCTSNVSSGIVSVGSTITWTPNTYYSFDAGTTQTSKSVTVTGPATYNVSPSYVRASSIGTSSYCTADKNNTTYYATGTNITWTAGSNYSFGGSSTADTTTTGPITAGGTFNAPNPGYVKCTISGTRCSANKTSGSILAVGTTITWTANTNYGFASGTTRTATTTQNVALGTTSYSKSANYINITVSATNSTANVANGYRLIGSTITWTASTGINYKYSFTNTPVSNPTDAQRNTNNTATIAAGVFSYSKTASYVYYNVTISPSTNYSANYSSGYILNGTAVTFTAPTNTTTKRYSFSTSSSETHTQNKSVSSAGQTLTNDTAYVWMNCTFTGSNCTTPTNGWYRVGTSQTYTANTGTNLKYAFVNTTATWSSSYGTASVTIVDGTTSYTKNASYIYYNVTISPSTNCTANYSSGYLLNNTTVTFTAKTATNSIRYSFSNSVSNTYTVTGTVSSAGQTISSGTVYIWYYITVNNTHEIACTITNGSNWYLNGSSITTTWTIPSDDRAEFTFDNQGEELNTSSLAWSSSQGLEVTAPDIYRRIYEIPLLDNIDYGGWTKNGSPEGKAIATYGDYFGIDGQDVYIEADTYRYDIPSDSPSTHYSFNHFEYPTAWTNKITSGGSITAIVDTSVRQYTITYKYYTNYSTQATVNVVYNYGDIPGTSTPISGTVPTPQTVTSGNNRRYYNGWDDLSEVTGDRTINATYTNQVNVTSLTQTYTNAYSDDSRTTDFTTGWKNSNTTIYWKGKTNYYYSSTSQNGTSTVVAGTNTYNPTYQKCHITSVRCGEGQEDGYYVLPIGNTITWVADDGYAFDTSGNTIHTQDIILGNLEYTSSADYKSITVNKTNATADVSSGYRHLGDYITWTPTTAGANTKYSCTNTIAVNPTDAQRKYTEQITTSKATYGNNSYTYYNVHIDYHPLVYSVKVGTTTLDNSYYYILSGQNIVFTATTATSTERYSFSNSVSDTYTNSITVSSAGQDIYSGDVYTWYNVTSIRSNTWMIDDTYRDECILSRTSTGWRCETDYILAMVNSNYNFSNVLAFDTGGATVKYIYFDHSGSYTIEPPYVKKEYVNLVRCTASPVLNNYMAWHSSYTITSSDSNWAFDNSGTQVLNRTIVPFNKEIQSSCETEWVIGGYVANYNANYFKITVNRTNCTTSSEILWRNSTTTITSTANTGYTFGSATSVNRMATTSTTVSSSSSKTVTHTAVKWTPQLIQPELYYDSSDGTWRTTNTNPVTVHVTGTWDVGDTAFSYDLTPNWYKWWTPDRTGYITIKFEATGYTSSQVTQYVHKATS